jgi:hypothetical protein
MGEMRSFPGGKDPRHLVYFIVFGMIQVEERLESGGSMDHLLLMRKRAPLLQQAASRGELAWLRECWELDTISWSDELSLSHHLCWQLMFCRSLVPIIVS